MMKKICDLLFLLAVVAFLFAIPAGTWGWAYKDTTAYYENRTLAAKPQITAEKLWDGSLGADVESWYSDHTPGRTTALKTETGLQMNLWKRPVVNDLVMSDKALVPFLRFDEYSREAYEHTGTPIAEKFGKLAAFVAENGGEFTYVGFPEQRVYFEEVFPSYLNSHAAEAETADRVFAELLTAQGVDFLDMRAEYDALGHPAELYSTVDHHYNYYGAYAAYRAILRHIDPDGTLPVLTEDKLDFTALPNPYLGSRNRKLYNLWENHEQAVIGVQKEPVAFERFDNGNPSEKPLFVIPAAEELPTTYNLYMGGDFGETVMKTNRPELPNALIFGDSFTNALETLLYASFNETHMLDLRHYKGGSIRDYIAEFRPDYVICIQNDTFYYTPTGNSAVWED